MRRLRSTGLLLGILSVSLTAVAQEPETLGKNRRTLLAREERDQVVRFVVTRGRIEAMAQAEGQWYEEFGSRHERLNVSTSQGPVTLTYELTAENSRLKVDVVDGARVLIVHETGIKTQPAKPEDSAEGAKQPTSAAATVEYHQIGRGPIVVTLTEQGQTQRLEGNSLWHLLVTEEEFCREHLLPIFELMRTNWRLEETAQAAEKSLIEAAKQEQGSENGRWSELVALLASDRFVVRQRAERELRAAGDRVVPFLESLERKQLDAEQWRRVNDVLAAYEADGEDSPERIALRLGGDRGVWLRLMEDEQPATRRLASQRLTALVGHAVAFDPDAEAAVRAKQVAALRGKLLKR